jgi:cellulose synthase/poly-beta-1,6-N-acetylglucosamine synthase-like glycosyltransferase
MASPEESLAEGPQSRQRAAADESRVALVIPSLGATTLGDCLRAVAALDPAPDRTLVVLTGESAPSPETQSIELLRSRRRLGFAAAVNAALGGLLDDDAIIAVLNDDAVPSSGWLGTLRRTLDSDPGLAAVQGTVVDRQGTTVDGRGIDFDGFGLPVQLDRGQPYRGDPETRRDLVAVSCTAALFRTSALRQVSAATTRTSTSVSGCGGSDGGRRGSRTLRHTISDRPRAHASDGATRGGCWRTVGGRSQEIWSRRP